RAATIPHAQLHPTTASAVRNNRPSIRTRKCVASRRSLQVQAMYSPAPSRWPAPFRPHPSKRESTPQAAASQYVRWLHPLSVSKARRLEYRHLPVRDHLWSQQERRVGFPARTWQGSEIRRLCPISGLNHETTTFRVAHSQDLPAWRSVDGAAAPPTRVQQASVCHCAP